MKGITYCGACADYDIKKHRCKRGGAKQESNPQDKFFDDCPLQNVEQIVRCEDCIFWESAIGFCHYHSQYYNGGMSWDIFKADDFCSYGERKNDE